MSDAPPPLPDLEDGLLDDAGLAALATDISALSTDITVRCKGVGVYSAPASLLDAVAALRAGAVAAVQIAYRYDGKRWIDTVMPAPGGWRVVRVAPQF